VLTTKPGDAIPGGGAAPSGGFSPSQIRHAYGFDQITFNGGTVKGDGTGQTIALIEAYDQPNIASDLAAFDTALGIQAPPSFKKVNQTGGTSYPAADQHWGLEVSLDVEWAHAMAPNANILLVEANSNNFADLFAAIDYARNQPGVSVVSMSFGTAEWNGETSYDSYYTTPSGHGGVTFVASSGDGGSSAAPEYPAISPNVLAVGGTTLTLDSSGNYASEAGWSGSGGGISVYYSKPSYQSGVVTQSSTMRTSPDVAYNGSSASPFGVYDTSGYSGWLNVYGTSAGAPQWAALVAIANQGRALAGQGSLDGLSQTMPKIYQMSSSYFHDITTGSNGAYTATAGYDLVTGRGTPYANLIATALIDGGSTNKPPTIVTPASATPNPVTGMSTNLSVQATDAGGAASLTYSWAVTSAPAGAAAPTFSANGTNAAQNTTATFHAAGSYTFQVTVTDSAGLTATSSVTVTVSQTSTSLALTPSSDILAGGATQQFVATAADQFGKPLSTQPTITWSLTGIGTLSNSGMYTAPASSGAATVKASAGGLSSSASVTVSTSAPSVVTPASATPSPVTGTTTNLSVLGTDAAGAANLTYTWTVTSAPAGAAQPTFSANGTNAAHNTVATFHAAGTYTFKVTLTDTIGLTASSTVTVVVNPTATSLALSPSSVSITSGTSQQFTATVKDQFGNALSTQPTFTWSVTSIGSVSSTGLYAAPTSAGTATVKAVSGALSGTATVTVLPATPTSVTASAVTSREVNITWQESTTGITGFNIERSTNGTNWTTLTTVGATVRSYLDRSVSRNRTYFYSVQATSPVGNSAWSAPLSTPSVQFASATTVLPVDSSINGGPTFHWMAASEATGFDLCVVNLATGVQVIRQQNLTEDFFTPANSLPVGTYVVWVKAFNDSVALGDWSAGMYFNVLAPAAPVLTGPATPGSNVTPTLTWSASAGATHYDLCINDLTTGQWQIIRSLTTNDFTTTPLHAGAYVAWVRAFDSANQTRGWSAGRYFTITPPAAPTLLSPAGTTTSVTPTFSWSAVADAVSYELCVEDLSTGRFQLINNLPTNACSSLTLSKGTYRFWVRAVDVSGDIGGWSTKVDVTIG
jgi:hypothetical protein